MYRFNVETWRFPHSPNRPLTTDDIYDLIEAYITTGIIKPGQRIPSYRILAEILSLPKTSISRVYRRLIDNGWLDAKRGVGTFVSHNFPNYQTLYPASRAIKSLPCSLGLSKFINTEKEFHFQDFATVGFYTPDPSYSNQLFKHVNVKEHAALYKDISQTDRIKALERVDFKLAILEHLNAKRNFMFNEQSLEIVLGRSESLKQVFSILLTPGDVVINTAPKDKMLCSILNDFENVDAEVMVLDEFFIKRLTEMLLHTKIKALYITPQCSYPDGCTLCRKDCSILLLLAKKYGFYIIEEDDYHEFWYEAEPFTPLALQDHNGHVVYCGAFSQISSYLRQTRTIVAAEEFIDLLKLNPLPASPFKDHPIEFFYTALLNSNKLWEYIKKMQRDMNENWFDAWFHINNSLSKFIKVKKTSSGLSFWLVFPSDEMLRKSIIYLEKKGFKIPYLPESQKPGAGVQKVKLGFGIWNTSEFEEPLKALFAKYDAF